MHRRYRNWAIPALIALLAGCAADPATSAPVLARGPEAPPPTQETPDAAWGSIAAALTRPGTLRDGVYVVTVRRDDLDVSIEGMEVPAAAGLESAFWFYRCPCGKMNVVGQFVTADYEANDVVDALRAGQMRVASIGPALLYEKPRLSLIRFQGEGDPAGLAKTIREALRWTGKERMAPRRGD